MFLSMMWDALEGPAGLQVAAPLEAKPVPFLQTCPVQLHNREFSRLGLP